MANKKLQVGGENLMLPGKKDKSEKKPGKPEPVAETPEVVEPDIVANEPSIPPEPTEAFVVATTPEVVSVEATTTDEAATPPDTTADTPAIQDEPSPTNKSRKLKVKASAPSRSSA